MRVEKISGVFEFEGPLRIGFRPGWKIYAMAAFLLAIFYLHFSAAFSLGTTCPLDLSDTPLDTQTQAAPPLIMFVLDDSGSMDWEFVTNEEEGVFWVDKVDHEYLFDDPGDNLYTTGVYSQTLSGKDRRRWKSQWSDYNKMYYNPNQDYNPWLDHEGVPMAAADKQNPKSHPARTHALDMSDSFVRVSGKEIYVNQSTNKDNTPKNNVCGEWLYTWSHEFKAGQNGSVTIERHTGSTGSSTVADAVLFVLDGTSTYRLVDNLQTAPYYTEYGTWAESGFLPEWNFSSRYTQGAGSRAVFSPNLPFDGTYHIYVWWNCYTDRDGNARITIDNGHEGVNISNAHYYAIDDLNGNEMLDVGEKVYLVNFEDQDSDGLLDCRVFYEFADTDGDEMVDPEEVVLVSESNVPAGLKTRSWSEELQNFANWFTYYRKRWLSTVAAISEIMPKLEGVKVGFRTINGNLVQPVLPVRVAGVDESETLLNLVHTLYFDVDRASTPLRKGLEKVGLYFHTQRTTGDIEPELETSPFDLDGGGECQQAFAVVFTDGYWNGGAPLVSNEDGDNGPPYADKWSGMLADVAMYYYENDLVPELDDMVPSSFLDKATHQHMVTYGITFGVNGHLNPDDYDLYNIDPAKRVYPEWPSPTFDKKDKIDDVWHAAVNGRGKYFNARNPEELSAAFNEMIDDLIARIGSGAPVSINGEELNEGSAIFQSGYNTENWTGDVIAYNLNSETGEVIHIPYKWSASEQLEKLHWDSRVIATHTGTSGIPFRLSYLTEDMKSMLGSDSTKAQAMLDYLRGDASGEIKNGGIFRDRFLKKDGEILRQDNKLSDIVHSGPVYHDNVVYVGANDGMLHALASDTGQEVFAYIPSHVFPNLADLADPGYDHRYYVDLTPYVKDTESGSLLVGGLGKGGKGYYCLDVTDVPLTITEASLVSRVKWEFPDSSTSASDIDDMGYSFSRAFIVPSKAGWIVVFGNGYNSASGNAVLFALDAFTGNLLAKIDTQAGPCNGMSTPTPVDIDLDGVLDYVYAGDLLGNLWKFDFTSDSPGNWRIAYQDGYSPAPLFKATDEMGNPQPITNMCDVMLHCKLDGAIVVFGTGKYLGDSDFLNTQTQTIYGIWDYGDITDSSEFLGEFQRSSDSALSNQPPTVSLLRQEEIYFGKQFGNYIRVLSDYLPNWATDEDTDENEQPNPSASISNHAGWYFDLPKNKERVVRDVLIRDGKAIVVTLVPDTGSSCVAGGESIVHEINACTGARMEKPQFDANNDSFIDEKDMIDIVISETGQMIRVAPSGLQYSSILYEPVILSDPPVEIKYFGSASGRIESLREMPMRQGFSSWREIVVGETP